eukprot:PhM_4_TR2485/c1_g6_i3/m.33964
MSCRWWPRASDELNNLRPEPGKVFACPPGCREILRGRRNLQALWEHVAAEHEGLVLPPHLAQLSELFGLYRRKGPVNAGHAICPYCRADKPAAHFPQCAAKPPGTAHLEIRVRYSHSRHGSDCGPCRHVADQEVLQHGVGPDVFLDWPPLRPPQLTGDDAWRT